MQYNLIGEMQKEHIFHRQFYAFGPVIREMSCEVDPESVNSFGSNHKFFAVEHRFRSNFHYKSVEDLIRVPIRNHL